jgi:hypothetical protein
MMKSTTTTKGHLMLEKTKDVQGISLYAEFRKPGATMQIFITPDGYAVDEKEVAATLYRRVVTPSTPKKQWRSSSLGMKHLSDFIGTGVKISDAHKDEFAEQRMSFTSQLFDGILNGGWTLMKEPIFLETSKKDLQDIRDGKTPNKLIYRINQSRDTQGFPAIA